MPLLSFYSVITICTTRRLSFYSVIPICTDFAINCVLKVNIHKQLQIVYMYNIIFFSRYAFDIFSYETCEMTCNTSESKENININNKISSILSSIKCGRVMYNSNLLTNLPVRVQLSFNFIYVFEQNTHLLQRIWFMTY